MFYAIIILSKGQRRGFMFDWILPGTKTLTLGDYSFHLLFTILITYFGLGLLRFFVHQWFKRTHFLEQKKQKTIVSIVNNTCRYLFFIVFVVAAIQPFFDLKQILVAGGVFGIVIGFGAQSLIKDIFAGAFLVGEEQFQIGDFVHINGDPEGGTVEELGFRVVKIRLTSGKLMFVPNGEIRKIVNGNIERRRIFESIVVSFRENPSQIKQMLEDICAELNTTQSHAFVVDSNGDFVESFHVHGLSSLDSSLVGYKFSIAATVKDTEYLKAVQATKELLAQKLYDENIKMPEQQMVYHTKEKDN
jgi:small conductance mechanosensitive channel